MSDDIVQLPVRIGPDAPTGKAGKAKVERKRPLFDVCTEGRVQIATLDAGPWHGKDSENVLSLQLLTALDALLDSSERCGHALVLTSHGKWFCNGLDMRQMDAKYGDAAEDYVERFYRLLGRMLLHPLPLVAAINGHAFAGGLLLAMACDYRVMTDGNGLLCMPEIDMRGEIQPGRFGAADQMMLTVLQNKLPPILVRDIMLQGRRLTAHEAELRGIVDQATASEQVRLSALHMAERWVQKPRAVFGVLKRELSRAAVEVLAPGLLQGCPPCTLKARL